MWTVIASGLPMIAKPLLFFVSYISSNTSFPQPLSPEEEAMYLERYEQGDEEARNILVERNLRLVAHVVKKYSNVNRDADDLISIGTIGLIKAITTFNRGKGTRLATYAARCIEKAMLPKCYMFNRCISRLSPSHTIFSIIPLIKLRLLS
ncbi:RNA polymerase, sigma 28 subunit, FliA/WhiG family [Alkaliphilus metalliredigens QYMF]|uniref:RNA polymerase, sigma 28 subunit, FliA/WhiG family n=1 Tax=Alkaliphilus metalliredigens (strain QYMF) TaxID=293826 RepID=A6TR10_ALKMQ|nr:sigma factor [Alkaliphilus metalliredigens]ABR48628.1 RNA polymerase, sigma 28 subunit, FliA/WhiG family [Alkaliphilus metalliredigens QYMF]